MVCRYRQYVKGIIDRMARMTRAERQAGTRASILSVARDRFLRDGYAATSLDQIAEDAGYSKGAVYSNFRDKPNLCREVLLGIHAEKLAEVAAIAAGPGEVDELLIALGHWLEKTVGDVGWTMLEMEFAVVSRNNLAQTQMLTSVHQGMHATIVDAIRGLAKRMDLLGDGDDQDAMLNDMADVIVATTFGLGVQRAVDPSVSIAPANYAIRAALASLGLTR